MLQKANAATANSAPSVSFQGSPEQHLFDCIGKDPEWGWDDAADAKAPGQ
jgi:hypothetical protein